MSEISALGTGLAGIQKGLSGMRKHAADIASAGTRENGLSAESLTTSIVGMKENQMLVQASAKVVKTVDDTIGSLLDELA